MLHKFNLKILITLLSILVISTPPSAAIQTLTNKSKKYVTLNSIAAEYGLKKTTSGKKITLKKRLSKKNILKLVFNRGSSICYMNGVKFGLSAPVTWIQGNLVVTQLDHSKMINPILRPKFIPNARSFRTIIIDPGHGGRDAGAVNRLGTEARYNLTVARTLEAGLKKKGYNVIMTRRSDHFLTLNQRVAIANRYNNAIFISIHFNASNRKSARGIETFTLSPVGVAHYGRKLKNSDFRTRYGNQQDSANIALATAVHGQMKEMTAKYAVPDRGIKRARFSVLSNIRHPAILIEGGFMSNPTEAALIESRKYQSTIATSVYKGILRYKSALNAK